MKIKVALLESDLNYLNRLTEVFNVKYPDKLEVYSFTDQATALATLESSKIDVFIANESFDIDVNQVPNKCGFAYFVEASGIEFVKGQTAISKFQKIELIYKQILSIYAEKAEAISGFQVGGNEGKLIIFPSVGAGAGTTTIAVGAALRYAAQGKRVLYLNLEKFNSTDVFFSGEGQFNLSDVVFALKSKKANLALKLESCIKQDPRKVFFFSGPNVALDSQELTGEDIQQLITQLQIGGNFDVILLDTDFSLENSKLRIFGMADAIVIVGDGAEVSNRKIQYAIQAINILEENSDVRTIGRMIMVYNKFSGATGTVIDTAGVRNIGGTPRDRKSVV